MINFIMTLLFVLFIVVTVVGFNRQMADKKKKDSDESID